MLRSLLISLRRFRARKEGATAVEFALIAPVLFLLIFGTIETGVIYMAGSSLQIATDNAARLVRTGQVQLQGLSQANFRTKLCSKLAPLVPCDNNLQIDVQTFTSYNTASFGNPLTAQGNLDPSLNRFAPGTACSVVLLRAFYVWPVTTPVLTPFLKNMSNNSHLLVATAAFRNEPFTSAVTGC